jgi:hypothetical protein
MRVRTLRAICLLAGLALLSWVVAWTVAPFLLLPRELAAAAPLLALVSSCAWLLLACLGWMGFGMLVTVHDVLRDRRGTRARLLAPAFVRRVVVVCVGVGLSGSVAGVASAQTSAVSEPAAGSAERLEGLVVPDRVEDGAVTAPRTRSSTPGPARPGLLTPEPGPERRPGTGGTVVVRPGDSLWTLAASRLSGDAGPAAVDSAWRRLYIANRPPLGADPDLIHPGDVLRIPRDLTPDREESR